MMSDTQILAPVPTTHTSAEPVMQPRPAITPMQMLEIAVSRGADLAQLEKLMDLQERWQANEARKAFVQAMAEFKAEPLKIVKNKHVRFPGGGKTTEYDHATLDNVVTVLTPALGKHGLTHRWETQQGENGIIRVTCVLTHVLGHTERVTLQSAADTSGSKNPIQAIASATTYLCRYTLLMITGFATKDMEDNDAAGSGMGVVTSEQADELQLIAESVGANRERFLSYIGAESFADIPAIKFQQAKDSLLKKGRAS